MVITVPEVMSLIEDSIEMYRQGEVPCDVHPVQVLIDLRDTALEIDRDLQAGEDQGPGVTAPALP